MIHSYNRRSGTRLSIDMVEKKEEEVGYTRYEAHCCGRSSPDSRVCLIRIRSGMGSGIRRSSTALFSNPLLEIVPLRNLHRDYGIVILFVVVHKPDNPFLLTQVMSGMGAYAGAARRRVHLATGHRPGRRQALVF